MDKVIFLKLNEQEFEKFKKVAENYKQKNSRETNSSVMRKIIMEKSETLDEKN